MTTITLTFDNGPDPDVTPHVLKTLKRAQVLATFFVLGHKLRDRRALAEQAHDEGHWIGNHTYNHLVPLGLSAERHVAASEIARTQDLMGDLVHERHLFRPFGGGGNLDQRLLNREALDFLIDGRYTCVLWNAIPEDWAHPTTWVDRALELCFAQDETLLVLHDLPTGAMQLLERFIETARDRGAVFRQEFPSECVPLVRGELVLPIEPYLTDAARLEPAV
jgi:peptidoglycan/xylan/chitin deacetylase (PgdA/CDA1 family)